MRHLRLRWLWLFVGISMVIAVVVASVINIPPPVAKFLLQDKAMHVLGYAVLMGWFAQLFRNHLARLVCLVILTAIGVGVEFIQATTPYRQFELLDMVANTSGVLLAWALGYTWLGTLLPRFEALFIDSSYPNR